MDEALKNDRPPGQVGGVEELTDVGPGRDELRRPLADGAGRGLGRVQFLEPGQAPLYEIDCTRPEFRQRVAWRPRPAGVPRGVAFATKIAPAKDLIGQAAAAGG